MRVYTKKTSVFTTCKHALAYDTLDTVTVPCAISDRHTREMAVWRYKALVHPSHSTRLNMPAHSSLSYKDDDVHTQSETDTNKPLTVSTSLSLSHGAQSISLITKKQHKSLRESVHPHFQRNKNKTI